jgi:hypothetical protein
MSNASLITFFSAFTFLAAQLERHYIEPAGQLSCGLVLEDCEEWMGDVARHRYHMW